MWNRILDSIVREKRKADYEKYKKALQQVVKTLTAVLERDDTIEVIAFGESLKNAFEKGEKE